MKPFEIYVALVSWGSGGKYRPVLVISELDGYVSVFRITSQYENKSERIQAKYFIINEWQKAGLDKQSYIDTGEIVDLPETVFNRSKPIGCLAIEDKRRLIEFLKQ
jgi:hypothetical protein